MRLSVLIALSAGFIAATPAAADDDAFGVWLNPSLSTDLDEDTSMEIETAQRFRDADFGPDTYYGRLWVIQDLSDAVSLAGGIERRINDGDSDETRFLQQVSVSSGIWRGRVRVEQRLVDDADRMGIRMRTRGGVSVPIDNAERWSFDANAEAFWTLRSTSDGGQDGLTGLRTQVGVGFEVSDTVDVSLHYLRQQDIRENRPDTIGHAPLLGVEVSF